MKIKKYTNGAWTDLDKPVKKFATYTDEATSLPLTIQTSATDAVENYQVYGASGGVGEATSGDEPQGYKIPILVFNGNGTNMLDTSTLQDNTRYAWATGISYTTSIAGWQLSDKITVLPGTNYYLLSPAYIAAYASDDTYLGTYKGSEWGTSNVDRYSSFTTPASCAYIRLCDSDYRLNDNILSAGQISNYDLFIGDSKLGEDEYLDYEEQKVHRYVDGVLTPQDPPTPFPTISTYIGENNISVDTTVQPNKVSVEYEGWKGIGDVEKYQNGEWSDNNDI